LKGLKKLEKKRKRSVKPSFLNDILKRETHKVSLFCFICYWFAAFALVIEQLLELFIFFDYGFRIVVRNDKKYKSDL